ncbi:MAG: hypothetical protein AAF616_08945 [Bacteroidota bacterium]
MIFKIKYALLLTSLVASRWIMAQQDSVKVRENEIVIIADSIYVAPRDTFLLLPKGTNYQFAKNKYVVNKDFYSNLYSKAQKSRITKELYKLLVTERPPTEPQKTKKPLESESFFQAYEGRKVQSIELIPVDILDGDVNDTSIVARSRFAKWSNKLHHNTRENVIRNYLLFRQGDMVDPFAISDTERVLRTLAYIEDVRIRLLVNPDNLQSVDAVIIYKDRFPWNFSFGINSDFEFDVGFRNRNILGSGHDFGLQYLYSPVEIPNHGYAATYTVRGISNSFIDGTVFKSDSYLGQRNGISFRRDFISPEIKYYGEATLETEQLSEDLVFSDSLFQENFRTSRQTYDLYGGRAFELGRRSTVNMAIRFNSNSFLRRPTVKLDSNEIFHNQKLLLGALSLSKINFLKTRNILAFNITEDIPDGFLVAILYGRDWNEFDPRSYRGIRLNVSKYTDYGYLSANLERGFFRNQGNAKNEVLELSTRYFSPLFDVGNSTARLFVLSYLFSGKNLSIPQSQTIEGINRIRNIDGERIRGDQVLTFSTEYVVYQPWYLFGFRFATYAHMGIGSVEESRSFEPYKETYYNFGGGIRVRNESLVFDTFEIRVALYPNPPPIASIFTFDFSLTTQSFFRSPNIRKPRIVGIN